MAEADEDLRREFSMLREKMVDTQERMKMADAQINEQIRAHRRAWLTHAEIAPLPDVTRLYERAGQAFILQPKEQINNLLVNQQKTADEKINELEQRKVYLERSVREAEDGIREMIRSRRAQ